jgi:hypothetical protein
MLTKTRIYEIYISKCVAKVTHMYIRLCVIHKSKKVSIFLFLNKDKRH